MSAQAHSNWETGLSDSSGVLQYPTRLPYYPGSVHQQAKHFERNKAAPMLTSPLSSAERYLMVFLHTCETCRSCINSLCCCHNVTAAKLKILVLYQATSASTIDFVRATMRTIIGNFCTRRVKLSGQPSAQLKDNEAVGGKRRQKRASS